MGVRSLQAPIDPVIEPQGTVNVNTTLSIPTDTSEQERLRSLQEALAQGLLG